MPAYLESTINARPLYEKHGFEVVEKIAMMLEGVEGEEGRELYEEICFVFRSS